MIILNKNEFIEHLKKHGPTKVLFDFSEFGYAQRHGEIPIYLGMCEEGLVMSHNRYVNYLNYDKLGYMDGYYGWNIDSTYTGQYKIIDERFVNNKLKTIFILSLKQ